MQPLFMFLNSSLNVELVYIILKGITAFKYHGMETRNTEKEYKKKKDKISFE